MTVADVTFERQAQLLETIHRCARELRDLVGDALVITIEPAGMSTRRSNRELADEGDAAVLSVFTARPGEWLRRRDVVNDAAIPYSRATRVFNRLVKQGALEHNGGKTNQSRYRLASEEAAAAPHGGRAPGPAEPQPSPDVLPGGASSNGQHAETPAERADRVVDSLRLEASTLTELCLHTGIPRRDLKTIVSDLEAAGRVVDCGLRFPQRHAVYGVPD